MEIKFLKAGSGDSILIHSEGGNILIDGGNDSTFLIDEYYKIIAREEKIDLLIITHHDDDHIKGILDLFKHIESKNAIPEIETVIFNSPKKINNLLKEETSTNLLSYKQAHELENILFKNRDINWITSLDNDINELFKDKFGEMSLKIFSPSKEILLTYASNKGAYLNSDYRCDWNIPIKELAKFIDDKSQDTSPSNKTSIVVYLTIKNKKILLTADVTPERLDKIIDSIREDKDKADFDLIKLPHHGSYRSLNSKTLEKINCKNYVVSTNSSRHYLPNKRAFIKIIQNLRLTEPIEFSFNYEEAIHKLKITDKEMTEYKIKLKPNTDSWGYGITF